MVVLEDNKVLVRLRVWCQRAGWQDGKRSTQEMEHCLPSPNEGPTMSEQTNKPPIEGWTWIIGSPKWHYMRDHRSLCGRWLLFVMPTDLEQGNETSADNCMACRRKLEKEQAKKK